MTTTQITADTKFGAFLGQLIAASYHPEHGMPIQNVWETGVHDGSGSMSLVCSAVRKANEASGSPRVWRYVGWESDAERAGAAGERLYEIVKGDAFARAEIVVCNSVKDSPMLRSMGVRPSLALQEVVADLGGRIKEQGTAVARYVARYVAREAAALKVPFDEGDPDAAARLYLAECGDIDGAGYSRTYTEFVNDDGTPMPVLPSGCTLGEAFAATVEFEQTARQDVGTPHPNLILLDSAGLLGYAELCTVMGFINKPCYIALDDTNHIKHARSRRRLDADIRFQEVFYTDDRFGSGVWKFQPAGWSRPTEVGK